MASELIFINPQGEAYYGGLAWRLLPDKGSDAELLRAARELDAKFATRIPLDAEPALGKKPMRRMAAGFYQPPIEDEGKPPRKKAHAVAAVFAASIKKMGGDKNRPALLLMRYTVDQQGHHVERFLVVAVVAGQPTMDMSYASAEEAQKAALNFIHSQEVDVTIVADSHDLMTAAQVPENGLPGLQSYLSQNTSRYTALKAKPFDVLRVGVPLLLLTLGGLSWYLYAQHEAQKAAAAALAKKMADDPIPKYKAALAQQRQFAGYAGEALQKGLASLGNTPTKIPADGSAWRLTSIDCGGSLALATPVPPAASAGGSPAVATTGLSVPCQFVWVRKNGTTAQLMQSLPQHTLVVQSQSESINLNQAQTLKNIVLEPRALPTELPKLDAFLEKEGINTLQNWVSTGQSVQLGTLSLWPAVAGVSPSLKLPGSVKAGSVEVGNVALPVLQEAFAAQPSNIVWTAFSVNLSENSKDSLAAARAKVKGMFYVQQ